MSERTDVVTVFLERDGRILLARRSDEVGTYTNCWAGISGYREGNPPLEQAYREVREETGFRKDEVSTVAAGEPLDVDDGSRQWRVHPFRFKLLTDEEPRLDREHTEYRWFEPNNLKELETVPRLWDALEAVR